MATALVRVELPERSVDFQRIALEPGVPLLDRAQSTARLLRVWLGRFVAEPEWIDANTVQFYVNDDQGRRIDAFAARPATSSDLATSLRRDVQALRAKLQQVQPRGRTEQAVLNLLRDRLEQLLKQPDQAFSDGALFCYRDSAPRRFRLNRPKWRLVWCWGYQRSESKLVQSVVCANPTCRRLYLIRKIDDTNCPKCHSPIPVFRFPWRKVGLAAACLMLIGALGGWGYWITRPRSSIEGQVAWSGLGVPVADAEIRIDSLKRTTRSNAQGRFKMDHLPGGALDVSVVKDGFRAWTTHAEIPAAQRANVSVELIGEGVLAGRVLDSVSHRPIAGVKLRPKGSEATLTTDNDGQFRLEGCRSGKLLVEIEATGYPTREQEITVSATDSTPADLELTGDAILVGRVVSAAQGMPMAEVVIRLEASGQTMLTDSDGWYAFTHAPSGNQEVVAETEGFATERLEKELVSGQERQANFKLAGAAKVSGTIVRAADSAPLAEAPIKISGTKPVTKSDSDGKFRFQGVTSGKATIEVTAPGFQTELVEAELSDTQETELTIKLRGDAEIVGQVTDELTRLPVAEADVRLADSPYQTRTDSDGKFRLAAVPSLSGKLDVQLNGYLSKAIDVRPAAKQETAVQVALSGNSTVIGRVIERWSEAPIAKARIKFPKSDFTLNTSSDGAFEIKGVRGGVKQQLLFEAPGFTPLSEEIVVQPGQAISKKVVMSGAATQTGVVVSAIDESPVAGAKVSLEGTSHQVLTNAQGQFTLEHVRVGTIEFDVSAKNFETRHIVETVAVDSRPVTILLGGNASVGGEVTDAATGRAIRDAEIRLEKTVLKTRSNAKGAYQLAAAFPGSAKLTVRADGYPAHSEQAELAPALETRHDFVLAGTATLTGTIIDEGGQPIPNASVQLEDSDYRVTTGKRGEFEMGRLRAGPTQLNVSAAMFAKKTLTAEPKAGQTQSLGAIKMRSSLTLRGTVVHAQTEKPVAKARLSVIGLPAKTETDDQGHFQLEALPARLLTLQIEAPGFVTDQITLNPSPDEEQELICMCPVPEPDEVFIVLSWKGGIKDLDAHLYRIRDQKAEAHVFSNNPQADNLQLFKANQNGHGPETVRIHPLQPGRYEFLVAVVPEEVPEKDQDLLLKHLSKSEAVVKVYRHGQSKPAVYHVGRNKRAIVWQPFGLEIVGPDKIIDHVYKAEHYRSALPPEISEK